MNLSSNKLAKSSKFLSPLQADGVLRNFAPSGTDFAKTWNPRSKLRGIPFRIKVVESIPSWEPDVVLICRGLVFQTLSTS